MTETYYTERIMGSEVMQRHFSSDATTRYYRIKLRQNTQINKLNIEQTNSYNVSVVLPCITAATLQDSPKIFTSERINSFFGKSLRSPGENFFVPFEWQTLYIYHPKARAFYSSQEQNASVFCILCI